MAKSSVSERADKQHELLLQGSPEGIYGDYMPPELGTAFAEILADDPPFDATRYEWLPDPQHGRCAQCGTQATLTHHWPPHIRRADGTEPDICRYCWKALRDHMPAPE